MLPIVSLLAAATLLPTTRFDPDPGDIPCSGSIDVVENYGADPKGERDSSMAIQIAIDTGQSLHFPNGTYRIDSPLRFYSSNAQYCFDGSTFITEARPISSFFIVTGSNLLFEGFQINGRLEQHSLSKYAVVLKSGSKNVTFQGCVVRNLYADSTRDIYGFYVDLNEVQGFTIEDCLFEDILVDDDGLPHTLEFSGGIYFNSSRVDSPSTGVIRRCRFQSILTHLAGGPGQRTDADAIRFFYSPSVEASAQTAYRASEAPYINIENCAFGDCMKRAVKLSGVHGVRIADCHVISNRVDLTMHEAVKVHGSSSKISIERLTVVGTMRRAFWASDASEVLIDGLGYRHTPNAGTTGSGIRLQAYAPGDQVSDITLRNITILDGGPEQLTAIYALNVRNLTLCDSYLTGWGNPVLRIAESLGGDSSGVRIENVTVQQAGYNIGNSSEMQTVSIRSDNNNSDLDGIDGVFIRGLDIVLAHDPPYGFKQAALLEIPRAKVHGLSITYLGQAWPQVPGTSLLTALNADEAELSQLRFRSTAPQVRALYIQGSPALTIGEAFIDGNHSRITIDTGSPGVSIGTIHARSSLELPIHNLQAQPRLLLYDSAAGPFPPSD